MKKLLLSLLVFVSFVSYGQVIEKETIYVLKMTEQEYNDYLNKDGKKQNTYPRYQKTTRGSFGVTGGYSSFLGNTSITNFSWGTWIDFGRIGLEYNMSVGLSDDILNYDYTNYKIGDDYYGGFSRNIGVFTKTKSHLYYGGGIQLYELYGMNTKMRTIRTSPNSTSTFPEFKEINEKKVLPYVTIGYIKRLNEFFTFKGGLIVSKFSMVNVGVGYSF